MRSATKKKTGKDPAYLAWLHSQPCAVPGCSPETSAQLPQYVDIVEAAHVGDRGLSQKCPDREAIPLCRWHHRIGPDSHHVRGKGFWGLHKLDKEAIIAELQRKYEEEKT